MLQASPISTERPSLTCCGKLWQAVAIIRVQLRGRSPLSLRFAVPSNITALQLTQVVQPHKLELFQWRYGRKPPGLYACCASAALASAKKLKKGDLSCRMNHTFAPRSTHRRSSAKCMLEITEIVTTHKSNLNSTVVDVRMF